MLVSPAESRWFSFPTWNQLFWSHLIKYVVNSFTHGWTVLIKLQAVFYHYLLDLIHSHLWIKVWSWWPNYSLSLFKLPDCNLNFNLIFQVCHSTGRDVTRSMGTHRAAIQMAHVIGAVSGPLIYRWLGFYGVFPLVLLLQVFAFHTFWWLSIAETKVLPISDANIL